MGVGSTDPDPDPPLPKSQAFFGNDLITEVDFTFRPIGGRTYRTIGKTDTRNAIQAFIHAFHGRICHGKNNPKRNAVE
jgi:hypothetical protein